MEERIERGWKQLEVLSRVFTVPVWSPGSSHWWRPDIRMAEIATLARREAGHQGSSPVIPRLVTLSSPLSSHLIVTCWILRPAPAWLGLAPLIHFWWPDRPGPPPAACASYPSPLSGQDWRPLAALSGPGSVLTSLTINRHFELPGSQPLVATPAPLCSVPAPSSLFWSSPLAWAVFCPQSVSVSLSSPGSRL